MSTLTTIRTITITNGAETREVAILRDARGYWLHDLAADPNADSLTQLADDSDSSVMDVIREHGFEVA